MAKKILVVDDELDMRTFVTTLLETSGYKPLSAVDGKEGMEIARNKKPSVVILDVMMPNESGIGMYRQLKTDPDLKNIPVIINSAKELTLEEKARLQGDVVKIFKKGDVTSGELLYELRRVAGQAPIDKS